ncbi:hypothetical protein ACFQAV_01045 [Companilactobacillus huachuanensis]|uniref:Uncharacterized protein n=1 Tax=Companilactobacillus huachuanensis TaxID=2559914 RepID=A0ABW1RH82_9LACO|nr:hypothetical protein [Companilactobacillus huachuanensis]
MSIINVVSNVLLLAVLMLTSDGRLRTRDAKGIVTYGLIALTFILKLLQPWSMMGYNLWLVLFLVILVRTNISFQQMVTSFRAELGFWNFLAAMLVGLIGFNLLYDMVRLLLPMAIIILLFVLINTKKSSQR